jgi:hypothetical protein
MVFFKNEIKSLVLDRTIFLLKQSLAQLIIYETNRFNQRFNKLMLT